MSEQLERRIRPAARHILTIGKGLIKDYYTALVELVKNAYDADATKVEITFELTKDNAFQISIQDDGHGMSLDTVLGVWLVPSTMNKVKRDKSRKGRILQGKKGIGRYAVSMLGDDLLMKTIDEKTNMQTEVQINWKEFEKDKYTYLDEVPIFVESSEAKKGKKGTFLKINASEVWKKEELDKLHFELKKLLSPLANKEKEFAIILKFKNFDYDSKHKIIVESFPLLETYHYRILGKVYEIKNREDENKNEVWANFTFENAYGDLPLELIKKEIKLNREKAFCGDFDFDIRTFDLDLEGIDNLARRNENLGKLSIKQLLRAAAGLSIYRGDFRIRPYGDRKFDWLNLNERRVNNPTLRLSNNQIIGLVNVQNEKISGLIEKANREGLRENKQYEELKAIVLELISELERRKYTFRRNTNKGNKSQPKPKEQIEQATDLKELKTKIEKELDNTNISETTKKNIIGIIEKEEINKKEQGKTLEKTIKEQEQILKDTIAVYQVQATLGKVINVVLHEGSKPLAFLQESADNNVYWGRKLEKEIKKRLLISDGTTSNLIIKIINNLKDIQEQSEYFIKLFNKLDDLMITKRERKKKLNLVTILQKSFLIFNNELENSNINKIIQTPETVNFNAYEKDFSAIFTNLIENSIYWLKQVEKENKTITVKINENSTSILIDFMDNGLGIDKNNIESLALFDIGFSTKSEGTGLGLAIAGEAASRNNGILTAIYKPNGAHFQIKLTKK